jgi:hypothetical protein
MRQLLATYTNTGFAAIFFCCSIYAGSITSSGSSVGTNLTQQTFVNTSTNSNVTPQLSFTRATSYVAADPYPALLRGPDRFSSSRPGIMPRSPESLAALANQHMSAYLQSYQVYGPATAEVSSAAGQQLQAEDTTALNHRWPLIPFADRAYWPYDPRMRNNADPPAVPEPAPMGLLLCAAGLSGLVACRRRNRDGRA